MYNKQRQANIQHIHICTKSEYLFSHQEYLSKCTPTHHCYIITFIWYQLSINVMLFSPLGFQNKQTQVSILQKWGRFDGLSLAADCQINSCTLDELEDVLDLFTALTMILFLSGQKQPGNSSWQTLRRSLLFFFCLW